MSSTISDQATYVAAEDHLHTELDGELVVLDLNVGAYYGIDGIGTRVWELLQEPRTIEELREAILAEYEVEADRCQQDLEAFLEDLNDAGLIEVGDPSDS